MKKKTVINSEENSVKEKDNTVISEAKKRQLSGLKPFKKGQSGNPKGRPQGIMDFRKRVELSIKFLAEQYVEKHNKDPKNKNNKMKVEDVDIMGDIFAQYMNLARNGNLKATDSLFDRVYGKAKQTVEIGGIGGGAISHEVEMSLAEADIDAWMEGWTKPVDNKKDDNKPNTRTEGSSQEE